MEQMGAVPLMCADDVHPGDIIIKRKRFYVDADAFGVSSIAYLITSDVRKHDASKSGVTFYAYDSLKLTGDKTVLTPCLFTSRQLTWAKRPPGLQSGGEIRVWHVKRDRCSP